MATTDRLEVQGNASKSTSGSSLANSDVRIKADVAPVTDALETLDRVRPVGFRYTEDCLEANPDIEDREYFSVMAQQFQDVFPEHVQASGDLLEDGSPILQVDTHPLTIHCAAAVQELHEIVRAQQDLIEELQERLARLESSGRRR